MSVLLHLIIGAFGGVILTVGLRWGLGSFGIPVNWPNGQPVSWTMVVAAGVVIGAVDAAVKLFRSYRRLLANRTLAEQQEWQFHEIVDATAPEFRRTISLFRRDTLQLSQRMTGTFVGRTIEIVDVSYSETTGSGKSRSTQTYTQTAYRFPAAGQLLCPFRLVPRSGFFRWLEGLFTATEVELNPPADLDEEQLAAFEKFRKAYRLSMDSIGVDTDRAPRVFHPYVVAWFSLNPGWAVESDHVDLLLWKTNRLDCGNQRFARLEEICELLKLFDAGERAAETLGAVKIERKPHDPMSSINKMIVMFFGVAGGMLMGFLLGMALVMLVHPLVPKGPWVTPAFFLLFFVPVLLGVLVGLRFGYVSATGNKLVNLPLVRSRQKLPRGNQRESPANDNST